MTIPSKFSSNWATGSRKMLFIRTKFWWNSHWMVLVQKCGRRFGPWTKMAPTVELSLTWDPMRNSHKHLLVWNQLLSWNQTFLCELPIGSYLKLNSAVQPSWSVGRTTRHNFGRGPSNDYFIKVWFQLSNWFQTRRCQTLLKWSLCGPLPKVCPSFQTSDQYGHHSRT
jgi:hypothetical protein